MVDGGVRDIDWIVAQNFPVFARYHTPIQSIGRWKVNAWQVPVLLRGATSKFVKVEPGDFILADADGAMIIPAQVIDQVLPDAEKLPSVDQRIRPDLSIGLSLADPLATFGHVCSSLSVAPLYAGPPSLPSRHPSFSLFSFSLLPSIS